jgi:16S rRNA (cytosine1402-N4)-methyltransferase
VSKRDAPHLPVLIDQVLDVIDPKPGQTIVDCTLGLGGHSARIVERIRPDGRLIGMDLDPANLRLARAALEKAKGRSAVRLDLFHTNFASIAAVLAEAHAAAPLANGTVDALLADVGVASTQIDDPSRGFSYRRPGPLDMRMNPTPTPTPTAHNEPASALIARLTMQELADALTEFGDEEDALAIAGLIVQRRRIKPIETTQDLMAIVCEARDFTIERAAGAKLHPAARTFQALRIMVNRELTNLDVLLEALPTVLKPGGVAAIISFHSGEDRRVKHAFMRGYREGIYAQESRDPLVATEKEIRFNPRARSAKLRWVRRA